MSKKKLLEESTIRSFMKLANLQPLTDKFLKESEDLEENKDKDEKDEEDEDEEELDEVRHVSDREDDERAADRLEEETEMEEGEDLEEGKESEGRPSSPKQKVKGVAKPTKMKGSHPDHKLKAMSTGNHHVSDTDTIEHSDHSNAPKKNNKSFEIVAESLDEEEHMEEQDEEGAMGSEGESGDHKEKMKGLIRNMLNNLKDMGSEYGMSMEISDEGGASPEGGEEMAPPSSEQPPSGDEDKEMMQEKLDEMVEKLTKRVAARLVKESKKRR